VGTLQTRERVSSNDPNEIIPEFQVFRCELPSLIDYWTECLLFWEGRMNSDVPLGMSEIRKGRLILERLNLAEASLDRATFDATDSAMKRVTQPVTEHRETHEPISVDDSDESVRGFQVLRCELPHLVAYWTECLLFWDWLAWFAVLSMSDIRRRDFIVGASISPGLSGSRQLQ
jgi:hypothetical protein